MSEAPAFAPLRVARADLEVMIAHCVAGVPEEACGLLAGPLDGLEPTGEVRAVFPCRNADRSAFTYTVDGRDQLAAMREAQAAGLELVGVWHSHTHTHAYPSPTDVAQAKLVQALNGPWYFPIVSLEHPEPVVRAYRIEPTTGEITEVPLTVT